MTTTSPRGVLIRVLAPVAVIGLVASCAGGGTGGGGGGSAPEAAGLRGRRCAPTGAASGARGDQADHRHGGQDPDEYATGGWEGHVCSSVSGGGTGTGVTSRRCRA